MILALKIKFQARCTYSLVFSINDPRQFIATRFQIFYGPNNVFPAISFDDIPDPLIGCISIELASSSGFVLQHVPVELRYRALEVALKWEIVVTKIDLFDLSVTANETRYVFKAVSCGRSLLAVLGYQLTAR